MYLVKLQRMLPVLRTITNSTLHGSWRLAFAASCESSMPLHDPPAQVNYG